MSTLDAVVEDVATDPHSYAVIRLGRLLPVRFKSESEAFGHLQDVSTDSYANPFATFAQGNATPHRLKRAIQPSDGYPGGRHARRHRDVSP